MQITFKLFYFLIQKFGYGILDKNIIKIIILILCIVFIF